MEKDHLVENAEAMGTRLLDGLRQAVGKNRHRRRGARPRSDGVRGAGGARRLGPSAATRTSVAKLDRKAWDRGAIVYARGQVLRLAPPLCITREEVDQLVGMVAGSIESLNAEV